MARKTRRRRSSAFSRIFRKILFAFLLVSLAAGFIGGFWFLSEMGPRGGDYSDQEIEPGEADKRRHLNERLQASIEAEEEFDEILVLRQPNREDLVLLEEAVEAQREYVEGLPNADLQEVKRLEALEKRYQDFAVQEKLEQSRALEKEASRLARMEDMGKAHELYLEALRIQQEINEEFPLSDAHDPSRIARLRREAEFQLAEPLHRESLKQEAAADACFEQKDWAGAQKALEKAMELQETLNRKHRGTRQADVARYEALKTKLVGILSGEDHLRIREISELAAERQMAGENLEAANYFDEAARLQKVLNNEFPDSPYASPDQVVHFQRKSQTAQSYQLGLEIEANHDGLEGLLAKRKIRDAIRTIVSLRRDIMQMQETYPRSSLNDPNLQVKIRYLNLIQNDIEFIQEHLYRRMLPVPESEGWSMLATEVTQGLYTIVMGTNPSRVKADDHPVDSVSWREAKTFCERLGWIMGKPVRLPTENEFRGSLGRLRYLVLEDFSWSASDSGGEAHSVAGKKPFGDGFFDLLGNVSEWLESTDRYDDEDAKHIGGHAQDSLEAIFTVPVRDTPRGERNRMTGFRIVARLE